MRQLGERPRSAPRSRAGPAARGIEVHFFANAHPIMNLTLAYRGRSEIRAVPSGLDVTLAPNLRRDRVAYDGTLKHPVRFREAIGALHDVVVSDLRYKPRDKSAYEAYKAEQNVREGGIRRQVASQATAAILKESLPELPDGYMADLEQRYGRLRKNYWAARQKYALYLCMRSNSGGC